MLTVFAMSEKGFAVVETLLSTYPGLVSQVIGARDESVSDDFYCAIEALCSRGGVSFVDRKDFAGSRSLYGLAVSWRWIIKENSARLIVFHDSILPRYRGFNPLVTALINGDQQVGVTALLATKSVDSGPIIAQSTSTISYPITIAEAIQVVLNNYRSLAVQVGDLLSRSMELRGVPQNDSEATYSLWRDECDYYIDWARTALEIARFVDAVGHPYRGAASMLNGELVRILKVEPRTDLRIENRAPGKVIFLDEGSPVVVCGEGMLRISRLTSEDGTSLLPATRLRVRFTNPPLSLYPVTQ